MLLNKTKENLRLALQSLKNNIARTFLTMLGIIVGIAAVICIVAVGQGAQNTIMENFEKIGVSTVMVLPDFSLSSSESTINMNDIEAIKKQIPYAKYVAPLTIDSGTVNNDGIKDVNQALFIYGMDSDGFNMLSPYILSGRPLNPVEYEDGLPSALIDSITATTIYGTAENAVERTIDIKLHGGNSAKVNIVGVATFDSLDMMSNITGSVGGENGDQMPMTIFVPQNTLSRITGKPAKISMLGIMAEDPEKSEQAGKKAVEILEYRHNKEGQGAYRLRTMTDVVDQLNDVMDIFTRFISIVASVSLLVGGIGVMNIMLVNVTERTREVGIRKALGAKPKDIERQFLSEAVILTTLGGLIGLLCGLFLAKILTGFIGITPNFSLSWSLLAITVSAGIGLVFGITPAKRAAKMHPIDALRYE